MNAGFILIRRVFNLIGRLGIQLGFSPHLRTLDREILEQRIFPFFTQSSDYNRILFVGCEWYTKDYEKIFAGKEYWTLDYDPKKQIYGAPKHHICDSMQNIDKYFAPGSLDLIICNGVIGWGLNQQQDIETTFSRCHQCLREKGILIIGWNDNVKRKHMSLEQHKNLQKFKPYNFPPLGTSTHHTQSITSHVYNFYIK